MTTNRRVASRRGAKTDNCRRKLLQWISRSKYCWNAIARSYLIVIFYDS